MRAKRLIVLAIVTAVLAVAGVAGAFDGVMPVPLAAPSHIFAPGPSSLGLGGLNIDPGSVGNFDGTVALAYLKGRATGGDGHRFRMLNDMRIMKGTYLAADRSQHFGTFAFT
jgi:hypothetical protein